MTAVELANVIGDVLTQIDTMLADPNFPMADPNWQILYALRKHLDDLQRSLVQATIEDDDPSYAGLTQQISNASAHLQAVIKTDANVNAVITDVSQIAGLVDQILKLIP
jgi:hypothetical protein